MKKKKTRVASTETIEEHAVEDVVMVLSDEDVEVPKSKRAEGEEVLKGKRVYFVSQFLFYLLLVINFYLGSGMRLLQGPQCRVLPDRW